MAERSSLNSKNCDLFAQNLGSTGARKRGSYDTISTSRAHGQPGRYLGRKKAMKKISQILCVLLSEVIALTCFWPGSTVTAQKVTATLDKNDPEIRAVLAEIESDIEKGRQEKKIAGLSIAIVYDQEVLLSKG